MKNYKKCHLMWTVLPRLFNELTALVNKSNLLVHFYVISLLCILCVDAFYISPVCHEDARISFQENLIFPLYQKCKYLLIYLFSFPGWKVYELAYNQGRNILAKINF